MFGVAGWPIRLLSSFQGAIETRRGGRGCVTEKDMRSSRKHFRPILRDTDAQGELQGGTRIRPSSPGLWMFSQY